MWGYKTQYHYNLWMLGVRVAFYIITLPVSKHLFITTKNDLTFTKNNSSRFARALIYRFDSTQR